MASTSLHIGSRVLSQPSTSSLALAAPRPAPRGAAPRRARSAAAGAQKPPGSEQAFRFKYDFRPESTGLSPDDTTGLPLSERGAQSRRVHELDDDAPAAPGALWPAGGAGAAALPNPAAQRFRIKQVCECGCVRVCVCMCVHVLG